MRVMAARLGDPQRRLPPVVHVAGTNGKGSTIAFLHAFFQAAGLRTHAYVSPHLTSVRECVRLSGRLIDDAYLAELLRRVAAAADEACRPTPFEALTLAAFLAFAENPADVVLLETGMGGGEDATNIIDAPAAAVITPISYDHLTFLGPALADIAGHKAGIIKAGAPVIVASQPSTTALRVIDAAAAALNAPVSRGGRDWMAYADGDGMIFISPKGVRNLPAPALAGAHQIVNAAAAIAVLEAAFPDIATDAVIAEGLRRVRWPGRLQQIPFDGPMQVWADGGHNDTGGMALAAWATQDPPIGLVIGMLADKDVAAFLEALAPLIAQLIAVPIKNPPRPAYAPEDIVAVAEAFGLSAAPAPDIAAALDALAAAGCARALVCGSLHLLPEILPAGAFDEAET
jgi:dihydrofolate synthase / folylpolyglutamate synthase